MPLFYPGYYPGTRPVKKKRGGRPELTYPDPFVEGLNEAITIDGGVLGIPQSVAKNLEADFNKQFRLIFIGDDKESKTSDIESLGTDVTEYEELPGALGVSFNLVTWKEKGFEAAATETLKNLGKSVFTLKDLGAQAERRGIWEPSLDPDPAKVNEQLSLSSKTYIDDWRKHANYAGLVGAGEYPNTKELKDWAGFRVVFNPRTKKDQTEDDESNPRMANHKETDFRVVDRYRDKILDLVQFGSAERADKLGDVQAAYIDSLDVVLRRNPKVLGGLPAGEQAKLDLILKKIDHIQELELKLKTKTKARTKFGDFLSYGKDAELNELREKVKLERNSFWYSTVGRKPTGSQLFDPSVKHNWYDPSLGKAIIGFDENDGSLGIKKLVAWAQVSDFRSEIFRYNEFIDNIAEGNIFRNIIWAELNKTKLKYFTPQYYTTHFVKWFLGYEGFMDKLEDKFDPMTGAFLGTVNKGRFYNGKFEAHELQRFAKYFNKLLVPINRAVKKVTDWLMKRAIVRGAFNLLSGQLIRNAINNAAAWVVAGLLSSTGIGAALAPIIAPLVKVVAAVATYAFEKGWQIISGMLSGDIASAMDKVANELANFLKCCLAFFITCFGCLGILAFLIIGPFLFSLTGSSTGTGGGGSIAGPGGVSTGSGSLCTTTLTPQDLPQYFSKTAPNPIGSYPNGSIGTIPNPNITDCFGICRGIYRHGGIDLNGDHDNGAPLYSPYDGEATVIVADQRCVGTAPGACGGYGVYVRLGVDGKYFMDFAHLQDITVTVGQKVHKGDLLGHTDNTGNSTGPHLHYEIRSGGEASSYEINPCYVFDCSTIGGGFCPTTIDGQ